MTVIDQDPILPPDPVVVQPRRRYRVADLTGSGPRYRPVADSVTSRPPPRDDTRPPGRR